MNLFKNLGTACCLGLGLVVVTAGTAFATCDSTKPLHFASGAHSAVVDGGVPRGEVDCYTLAARAGQRLKIVPENSKENLNIVLQIYQPGWRFKDANGEKQLDATGLPGAKEGQDAKSWSGTLPDTGAYLLVIGTSWGGGDYSFTVDIR